MWDEERVAEAMDDKIRPGGLALCLSPATTTTLAGVVSMVYVGKQVVVGGDEGEARVDVGGC